MFLKLVVGLDREVVLIPVEKIDMFTCRGNSIVMKMSNGLLVFAPYSLEQLEKKLSAHPLPKIIDLTK